MRQSRLPGNRKKPPAAAGGLSAPRDRKYESFSNFPLTGPRPGGIILRVFKDSGCMAASSALCKSRRECSRFDFVLRCFRVDTKAAFFF